MSAPEKTLISAEAEAEIAKKKRQKLILKIVIPLISAAAVVFAAIITVGTKANKAEPTFGNIFNSGVIVIQNIGNIFSGRDTTIGVPLPSPMPSPTIAASLPPSPEPTPTPTVEPSPTPTPQDTSTATVVVTHGSSRLITDNATLSDDTPLKFQAASLDRDVTFEVKLEGTRTDVKKVSSASAEIFCNKERIGTLETNSIQNNYSDGSLRGQATFHQTIPANTPFELLSKSRVENGKIYSLRFYITERVP